MLSGRVLEVYNKYERKGRTWRNSMPKFMIKGTERNPYLKVDSEANALSVEGLLYWLDSLERCGLLVCDSETGKKYKIERVHDAD